jgi:hypothetical protein
MDLKKKQTILIAIVAVAVLFLGFRIYQSWARARAVKEAMTQGTPEMFRGGLPPHYMPGFDQGSPGGQGGMTQPGVPGRQTNPPSW